MEVTVYCGLEGQLSHSSIIRELNVDFGWCRRLVIKLMVVRLIWYNRVDQNFIFKAAHGCVLRRTVAEIKNNNVDFGWLNKAKALCFRNQSLT